LITNLDGPKYIITLNIQSKKVLNKEFDNKFA